MVCFGISDCGFCDIVALTLASELFGLCLLGWL